jgi:hypothetical protein
MKNDLAFVCFFYSIAPDPFASLPQPDFDVQAVF